MTVRDRIIAYLQSHPEGIDDDDLASILGLSARQQANIHCRQLAKDGLVSRKVVHGKIHNFWAGTSVAIQQQLPATAPSTHGDRDRQQNWFWEGSIQARVVSFLAIQGYKIVSVADTASHQRGVDIVAEKAGTNLWVTVKGYPAGTGRTNPTVQAAHYFKDAIFDVLAYRQGNQNLSIVVALPDFPRYHSLASKIGWFKPVARFSYFWVQESGSITVE